MWNYILVKGNARDNVYAVRSPYRVCFERMLNVFGSYSASYFLAVCWPRWKKELENSVFLPTSFIDMWIEAGRMKPGKAWLMLAFYFTNPWHRVWENKTDIRTCWELTDLSQALAAVAVKNMDGSVRHAWASNSTVISNSCLTLGIN